MRVARGKETPPNDTQVRLTCHDDIMDNSRMLFYCLTRLMLQSRCGMGGMVQWVERRVVCMF